MRHAEMSGTHRGMNPTHGVDRENRFGTRLFQRPEVGAVVHLMRRKTVRMTVAREKKHVLAGVLADLHFSRRRAVRRVHRQRLTNAQAFKLSQAGAADNRVNRHNKKSSINQLSLF